MKRLIVLLLVSVGIMLSSSEKVQAQSPDLITQVIKEGIKKVIQAIDLQIQRVQTQTIWLQNAQKVMENTMSKLKLAEITDWVQKQKDLYGEYFDELRTVKNVIAYYQRVRDITDKQFQLVSEYQRAYELFRKDKNFSPSEIDQMYQIYTGILNESIRNLDRVLLVINSFTTQMTDGKRLELINLAGNQIDENYSDLRQFNSRMIQVSIRRSSTQKDLQITKQLYGLQ